VFSVTVNEYGRRRRGIRVGRPWMFPGRGKGLSGPVRIPFRVARMHTRTNTTRARRDVCAPETQQWSLLMITRPCVTTTAAAAASRYMNGRTDGRASARVPYAAFPRRRTPAVPNFVLREIAFGKLKRVSRCNCRKLTFFKIPLVSLRARFPSTRRVPRHHVLYLTRVRRHSNRSPANTGTLGTRRVVPRGHSPVVTILE